MSDTPILEPRPVLKPWIASIHAYVPGKSKAEDGRELVKLSANENPLGCSQAALDALAQGHHPNLYPDPDATRLREAIGAVHGIDPSRIICGTGSGELLHGAVQAFAGSGDEVLASRYSFSLYPLLAEIEELMPAISAMRGGAGSAVQAPLHALLEEVNAIVAHLEGECALVRDEVHSVSNRRRASIAYASRNGLGSGESD